MNKNLKNKTAFSLIELSIVILIVGIVVAGVTQSSRLISAFRTSSARSMTNSSPVASMRNIIAWFDTTSEKSFLESESDNGLTISTWYDINPTGTVKNNATQSTSGYRPTYTTNCVNSLPCLRFGGTTDDDYFSYDGTALASSDYSVIIVEQRRDSKINNYFMGGIGVSSDNANLHLGYRNNTTITLAQHGNDLNATVTAYSAPRAAAHVFIFNSSVGKYYYLNGGTATTKTDAGGLTGLTSYANASIGAMNTAFFDGDICEVIIFNRAIKNEERTSILQYLGKKWGITIS